MPVNGNATGGARPKLVVEYLQGQGTGIARGGQSLHEVDERQVALTWKVSVMPAPGEIVHLQQWRVRHLHQEDLVAGDGADGAQVRVTHQDVEGVEHHADGWMIGAANRFPRIAVVIDVLSPGQGLERHAQAAFGRPLAEFIEVGGGAIDTAKAIGSNIATNHQQVAAELAHYI